MIAKMELNNRAATLKSIIKDFMGESAVVVLEYQLSKRLAEEDPFRLLIDDPTAFYNALASIFGPNAASILLRLLFKQVADKYKLKWLEVDKLIESIITGKRDVKEQIARLIQEISITKKHKSKFQT